MHPEAIAATLCEWQQWIRWTSGGQSGETYQLNRYAEAIRALDVELGDEYVASFVGDLGAAVANTKIGEAV